MRYLSIIISLSSDAINYVAFDFPTFLSGQYSDTTHLLNVSILFSVILLEPHSSPVNGVNS